jgi:23S rRNA (guanosine2251-2'-O)-methyltransferase
VERKTADCTIGINSILELIRYSPERISKVLLVKSEDASDRKNELIDELKTHGIPLEYARKDTLNNYAGTDSHQGFVAILKSRPYLDPHNFLENAPEESFVLAIDSVFDPHNFGAILRCAECFGVDAVIWSKNRGVGITPVVTKTSSGASEILPLMKVSNLASALQSFQKKGYSLIAADADDKAEALPSFTYPKRSVLILGSEGEGIQPLIRKMCDHIVYIPMKGRISSLNVAQAAAVFLSRSRI